MSRSARILRQSAFKSGRSRRLLAGDGLSIRGVSTSADQQSKRTFHRFGFLEAGSIKNLHCWVLPLLLSLGSGVCFAQSTNAGDIRGTVTDPSGALIPGVTVSVLNVDTGISKDFVTN